MKTCLKVLTSREDKNDLLAVIAASKGPKKKNLQSKQVDVLKAYDYYAKGLADPKLSPMVISKAVHKSYYSLFDGVGPTIKKLKEYIRTDAIAVCLYCDLNEYDSLDHYLPRGKFPEFSMSSRNLVPICTVCNRDWKKEYWGGGKARPFLHPNIDYLESVNYLICSVNVAHNSLSIKFDIDTSGIVDAVMASVLVNHFKNLDLATRLRNRTQKDEVDDLIKSMEGKNNAALKEAALMDYVNQLLKNKRDPRLQAFYKGVHAVVPQIAAVHWPAI